MVTESESGVPFVERRRLPRQQVYVVAICYGAGKEFQCIIKNFSPEGVLFSPTETAADLADVLKADSPVRLVFEYSLQKYDLQCRILRILDVAGGPVFAGQINASPGSNLPPLN